jgi:hypothetical protein
VIDRNQVHEGMVVRSSDGKKLGRVMACEEESFIVEKGFFFSTDYVARYDDVTQTSGDEIRLSRAQKELTHRERVFMREGGLGESFTLGMGGGLDTSPGKPWAPADEEEGDEAEAGSQNKGDDPAAPPPS